MDKELSLVEYLLKNSVSVETVRVLQEQQLDNASLLEEIDVSTLVNICGFKAGEALMIKRHARRFGDAENEKDPIAASMRTTIGENQSNTSESSDKEDGPLPTKATSLTLTSPFKFEEKKKRMLFRDFKLTEKFSPNVTIALENKSLSGNERHEFIRDICSHISSHGVYFLNKTERHQVAAAIVSKYPFLKDPIGSGMGSWDESIKNRFKHVKKYDAKKRKISCQDTDSGGSSHAKPKDVPIVKRIKRADFWNEVPTVSKEKESVVGEHLVELKKECSLPTKKQNMGKINQLMVSSFEYRRFNIMTKLSPVKELVEKYPPLKTVSGIRQEFCRVINDENAVRDIKERFIKYAGAITKYCREQRKKSPFIKNMLRFQQEADAKEAISKEKLLRPKNKKSECDVIKIVSEDENLSSLVGAITFPTVVRVGENPFIPLKTMVCVEGEELLDVSSLSGESTLLILYALYYIFSISYPNEHMDFFLFLDSVIVGLSCVKGQTRISIQHLAKELQKFTNGDDLC